MFAIQNQISYKETSYKDIPFDTTIQIEYKKYTHEYESELQYRIQLLKFFKKDIDDNVETTFIELFEKELPKYIESIYNYLHSLEDNESKTYLKNILHKLKQIGFFIQTDDNVMYFMLLFSYDFFEITSKFIQKSYVMHKIDTQYYDTLMKQLQA